MDSWAHFSHSRHPFFQCGGPFATLVYLPPPPPPPPPPFFFWGGGGGYLAKIVALEPDLRSEHAVLRIGRSADLFSNHFSAHADGECRGPQSRFGGVASEKKGSRSTRAIGDRRRHAPQYLKENTLAVLKTLLLFRVFEATKRSVGMWTCARTCVRTCVDRCARRHVHRCVHVPRPGYRHVYRPT